MQREAERGFLWVYLSLIKKKKNNRNVCADTDKSVKDSKVFHEKSLFLDRYRDLKVLPSQQTDHELLIKAADSAHI